MTEEQTRALQALCIRYQVPFGPQDYLPAYDLPKGWVAGWVGGADFVNRTIYVGCSPTGEISS